MADVGTWDWTRGRGRWRRLVAWAGVAALAFAAMVPAGRYVIAATVVPNEVHQPGTQPADALVLESPDKCDNCHGGYNSAVEPAFNWRDGMMANAGRDPIFWATLAVVEQSFDGAGDLCLRCHSTAGWQAGRSTPTDGSGLQAKDADGVVCDACHKMTNPNQREIAGTMAPGFAANDRGNPPTGYYGSGMMSLYGGAEKLGPYADAVPPHSFLPSKFHRSADLCGTCHDVSNPAVGDLAHNNGRQPTSDPVDASGSFGSPLKYKAAFNNLPFKYGVVERTFSEHQSGLLSQTPISAYGGLPPELKAGAIQAAYQAATAGGGNGDYVDGTVRLYTCQACHMRPVTGYGCNKSGAPLRTDLPLHDMTGGNYWAPDAIKHQNAAGQLRLGGSLSSTQIAALDAGKDRAKQQLALAASLSVAGNVVTVTNLTGHKLITGFPEGRRMWLNVRWLNGSGQLLREDGRYDVVASINGTPVKSLVDLAGTNTRIYEAHYGMTREWAQQMLALGWPASFEIGYDRVSGAVTMTLGQLAALPAGAQVETFHFVLNNTVVKDNRIPTYGMSYSEAARRNALPVPASQYGNPGLNGTYRHWDEVSLSPPAGAATASIRLMYQPTSWEYVQFLYLANKRASPFLGQQGVNLLNTWLATGMAEPYVMASATWSATGMTTLARPALPGTPESLRATAGKRSAVLAWSAGAPAPSTAFRIYFDQAGKRQLRGTAAPGTRSFLDTGLSSRTSYAYVATAWSDFNGNGQVDPGEESTPSRTVSVTVN